MFGVDLEITPRKFPFFSGQDMFTPSFPDISTDIVDLTEPEFQFGDDFLLSPLSLENPSIPECSKDVLDLTETEYLPGSDWNLTAVPLANDAFGFEKTYTPAKRCLDADFQGCQMDSSTKSRRLPQAARSSVMPLMKNGMR